MLENIRAEAKAPKNRKIIIVLALALVMMAATALAVRSVLEPSRTTVFIFNQNYPAGTHVTRDMLTGIQVDSTVITGGAGIPIGDRYVTGDNVSAVLQSAPVLRMDVYSGTAAMASMLTTTGGNAIEQRMRPNAVAVTIPVNDVTGVTAELAYGSRVNVYASYNAETILLLQNMRVLRSAGGTGGLASVTIEVSVEESLKLVHAHAYGIIHLGIVDAHGYQFTAEEHPSYNITGFTVPADIYYQSGADAAPPAQEGWEELTGGGEDTEGGEESNEAIPPEDDFVDATDPRNPAEILISPPGG